MVTVAQNIGDNTTELHQSNRQHQHPPRDSIEQRKEATPASVYPFLFSPTRRLAVSSSSSEVLSSCLSLSLYLSLFPPTLLPLLSSCCSTPHPPTPPPTPSSGHPSHPFRLLHNHRSLHCVPSANIHTPRHSHSSTKSSPLASLRPPLPQHPQPQPSTHPSGFLQLALAGAAASSLQPLPLRPLL